MVIVGVGLSVKPVSKLLQYALFSMTMKVEFQPTPSTLMQINGYVWPITRLHSFSKYPLGARVRLCGDSHLWFMVQVIVPV